MSLIYNESIVNIVTFNEVDVDRLTFDNIDVLDKIIKNYPSQSGSLTYNGSYKTPTWNNYNPEQLNLSVSSQVNAGTYYATFTPKKGYKWSDKSSSQKSISWTINKATGTYSTSTSASVVAGNSTSISITKTGNATSTYVRSSNTSVATVTATSTVITITGVEAGSATITWYPNDTSNYTYPGSKSISVTVIATGEETFKSNGTFVVPIGVTTIYVTATGGGGGGGGGGVIYDKYHPGSSSYYTTEYSNGTNGGNGGKTSLGTLLTLKGGTGGKGGSAYGGNGANGTSYSTKSISSSYGNGGAGGTGGVSKYVDTSIIPGNGGKGGRGENCSEKMISVTPGESLSVVIGNGGTRGSSYAANGQKGYMHIRW